MPYSLKAPGMQQHTGSHMHIYIMLDTHKVQGPNPPIAHVTPKNFTSYARLAALFLLLLGSEY